VEYSGFHSEWITIKHHRILLQRRCGFPDDNLRFVAQVTVEMCIHNVIDESFAAPVRVVSVFEDDTHGSVVVTIAATSREQVKGLQGDVTGVLQSIYNSGIYVCNVVIVEPGDTHSDHYDPMEHLSVKAGVSVDRFSKPDGDTAIP